MTRNTKPTHLANPPPPAGGGRGRGAGRPNTPAPSPSPQGGGGKNYGFTLVSAIFLMVVLVVLGASLVTLGSVQHITSAQQLQAVRAYYAARAGAEWAAARITVSAACTGSFELGAPTVGAFTVNVACTNVSHNLGLTPKTYYVITSTATSGNYGGTDFVSRQIESKVLR